MKRERVRFFVKHDAAPDPERVFRLTAGEQSEQASEDLVEREGFEIVGVVREQEHGWDSEGRPL